MTLALLDEVHLRLLCDVPATALDADGWATLLHHLGLLDRRLRRLFRHFAERDHALPPLHRADLGDNLLVVEELLVLLVDRFLDGADPAGFVLHQTGLDIEHWCRHDRALHIHRILIEASLAQRRIQIIVERRIGDIVEGLEEFGAELLLCLLLHQGAVRVGVLGDVVLVLQDH